LLRIPLAAIVKSEGTAMAKKKTAFEKGISEIATIVLDQLEKLPPDVAKAKRAELHRIAVNASRRAKSEKRSPLSRNRATHPSTRSRAKTA
jgi:hypothetical protein